jgi:hypothetical protein
MVFAYLLNLLVSEHCNRLVFMFHFMTTPWSRSSTLFYLKSGFTSLVRTVLTLPFIRFGHSNVSILFYIDASPVYWLCCKCNLLSLIQLNPLKYFFNVLVFFKAVCCSHVRKLSHHYHSLQQKLNKVFLKLLILEGLLLCYESVRSFGELGTFVFFLLSYLSLHLSVVERFPGTHLRMVLRYNNNRRSFKEIVGYNCVEKILILLMNFSVLISKILKQRCLVLF